MKLMITGTREGMTLVQWEVASNLAEELFDNNDGPHEFRDGDCHGADTQMHGAVSTMRDYLALDIKMIGYPANGSAAKWRAYNEYDELHDPQPPMQRNSLMVSESDVVIAGPKEYEEVKVGSGTWGTMRSALRQGKELHIVWPDGTVTQTWER
jgi:hypothetical protein